MTQKTQITLEEAARLVVKKILESDGLGSSTFCDLYPDAYIELVKYRPDMEASVIDVLRGKTIFER